MVPQLVKTLGLLLAAILMLNCVIARAGEAQPGPPNTIFPPSAQIGPVAPPVAVSGTNAAPAQMEVNQAVMVTVELDLGSPPPSIAEALKKIERRHAPADGRGRTFAVLDAYGEPTPQGKLHMSMHVSTEKPGLAALVLRKTGEVLWQTRVVANTNKPAFTGKNLMIFLDNGGGQTWTIDGSRNPASILDATLKEVGASVRDLWPDGAEREITMIYSACGCPVKVMAQRQGERIRRTRPLPVIFPDDPAVVGLLDRLIGW